MERDANPGDRIVVDGGTFDWVNCGLCVDERGAAEAIDGVRRGTPGDMLKMADASDNTLVIPTK